MFQSIRKHLLSSKPGLGDNRYDPRDQPTSMNVKILCFACLFLMGSSSTAEDANTVATASTSVHTPAKTLIVLGDSISAGYGMQIEKGWVNLMADTLTQREIDWQVVNASVSGETTGGGLARLPGVLTATSPQIVVIELGGNDGLRGYPISKMKQNLSKMVDLVLAANAKPVLVAMRIPANYGPRYTRAFEQAFTDVSASTGAILVPFSLQEVAVTPGLIQDDGIHPTEKAQPLLVETFLPFIEPLL
jgi:acyl-CoA thioesterase-1